jgi:ornithine carbamoyltransferase
MKHFIDLDQFSQKELRSILNLAKNIKHSPDKYQNILRGKNLAMIFSKSSTRTRASFEVAINQLGGNAIVMNHNDMQLGKGEEISDTAIVLSRYVDFIMIRCHEHDLLTQMREHSSKPIINALTNFSHPCQIMASIMAIEEKFDADISTKTLSWFGDANNVLNSYIHAALQLEYTLNIAIPKEFDFSNEEIIKAKKNGAKINIFENADAAAKNSDALITDCWFSMGQGCEDDQKKKELLMPFQINENLMETANKNAIFTHCLPAFRGMEVKKSVIDGENSIIFEEAENRLHVQKAILLFLSNSLNS